MLRKLHSFASANYVMILVFTVLGVVSLSIYRHDFALAMSALASALVVAFFKPGESFKAITYFALLYPIVATGMVLIILMLESKDFFDQVSWWEFLFGSHWKPHGTISPEGKFKKMFGVLPLIAGTMIVTFVATIVAVPLGILSALHISHFGQKNRVISKTVVEILSAIPSVIYGYFAFSIIAPFIANAASNIGISIALESPLAAGIVMGIMIMPLVISTVDDVLDAVPKNLYYGALVLGSTKSEAIVKVVLPVAMPGILSAVLLAITRAIGETVIVLMATGVIAKLSFNIFEPVGTINVQIATLITGDQDASGVETLASYTLGFMLFVITWVLNSVAATFVNRNAYSYRD